MEKLRQFLINPQFSATALAEALVSKSKEELSRFLSLITSFKAELLEGMTAAKSADERTEYLTLTRNAKTYFETVVAEIARREEAEAAAEAEVAEFEAEVKAAVESIEEAAEEEAVAEEEPTGDEEPLSADLDDILDGVPASMAASAKKEEKVEDPLFITAAGGPNGSTPKGFSEGQHMSLTATGTALGQKLRTVPLNDERRDFAQMNYQGAMVQMAKGDPGANMAAIEEFSMQRAHDALTAAGCLPYPLRSDQFRLDFCNDTFLDYADFVGAPRGGFQFYPFEGIADLATADVDGAIGNQWDGVSVKDCLVIDCLPPDTCEVDAFPTCLLIPNDLDRFAPERRDKVIRDAMQLHKERVATAQWNAVLADIALDANRVYTYSEGGGSVIAAINAAIAHVVSRVRGIERKCDTPVLVFVEQWLFDAGVADLGYRAFTDLAYRREDIINFWRQNNVVVRSIGHWTPLADTDTEFPGTADIVAYLPGSYILGDGGTLDLGISRGPSVNVQNQAQLFLEQWLCMSRVGPRGHRVTVDICAKGQVGASDQVCAA